MTAQQWMAIGVACVCALLLLRLVVGARRRVVFDRVAARFGLRMREWAQTLRYWRSSRRAANQAVADAMRKAREGRPAAGKVQREGNVYTPDAFKGPPKSH